MTHHVPMFSGGLSSWWVSVLVARQMQPGDHLTMLFADVKGDSTSPHVGEDEDTYRFITEASAHVLAQVPDGATAELVDVMDGRNIWEVFRDKRYLGNTRLANCSHLLKQKPCRDWLTEHADPDDTVLYVGIGGWELERLPAITAGWAPYAVDAPLSRPPLHDPESLERECRAAGMEVPRLYRAGFPHNNCGGFCVKAGQAQMELLLREHPERYAYHEGQEQQLREHLGKDVAVLRDRRGGTTVPLTLTRFRERLEDQPDLFDGDDYGGCGCFLD